MESERAGIICSDGRVRVAPRGALTTLCVATAGMERIQRHDRSYPGITPDLRTQALELLFREQSFRMNLGQHHQRARAFWIIENARHLSTALLDDLEDIKVALMRALTRMHHTLNLREYSFAEAFESKRV